eukprot:1194712-Prorocentrum_minimum.AAC.6
MPALKKTRESHAPGRQDIDLVRIWWINSMNYVSQTHSQDQLELETRRVGAVRLLGTTSVLAVVITARSYKPDTICLVFQVKHLRAAYSGVGGAASSPAGGGYDPHLHSRLQQGAGAALLDDRWTVDSQLEWLVRIQATSMSLQAYKHEVPDEQHSKA